MGIYSDGCVYGVRIIINTRDIYNKTYLNKITREQALEASEIYASLSDLEKSNSRIMFQQNCSSTYSIEPNTYVSWFNSSIEELCKLC